MCIRDLLGPRGDPGSAPRDGDPVREAIAKLLSAKLTVIGTDGVVWLDRMLAELGGEARGRDWIVPLALPKGAFELRVAGMGEEEVSEPVAVPGEIVIMLGF